GSAPHTVLHSFPTRRSSDLAPLCERGEHGPRHGEGSFRVVWSRIWSARDGHVRVADGFDLLHPVVHRQLVESSEERIQQCDHAVDRKSTRLNSSHVSISYAV